MPMSPVMYMRIEGVRVPMAVTSSLPILRVGNLTGGDMAVNRQGW